MGTALGLVVPAFVPSVVAAEVRLTSVAQVAPKQHFPFGPVIPPRTVPDVAVTTHRGQASTLSSLLRGRVTAMQLMFTGCSATCPLQGALFAQASQQLGVTEANAQFLSLSVDPLSDTPQALTAWLRQFSSEPGWLAAAPRVQDVDAIVQLLGEGGESASSARDPHAGQVYLIDKRGALVLRTTSMPPARQIVEAIRQVVARG